jgi:hypothetical protein
MLLPLHGASSQTYLSACGTSALHVRSFFAYEVGNHDIGGKYCQIHPIKCFKFAGL